MIAKQHKAPNPSYTVLMVILKTKILDQLTSTCSAEINIVVVIVVVKTPDDSVKSEDSIDGNSSLR